MTKKISIETEGKKNFNNKKVLYRSPGIYISKYRRNESYTIKIQFIKSKPVGNKV